MLHEHHDELCATLVTHLDGEKLYNAELLIDLAGRLLKQSL